jgi:Protein of unknown function VcgC/VcgE (DUF2780)
MQELITSLVSQLGVSQAQAQGGAGAIFKAAQDRLGTGQFEQLLGNVPGVKDLLAHAPSAGDGGGGLGGMLGGLASLAGKMGRGDMAQAAQLLAAMNSLGINKDTLMKFVPVVMKFLESKGGPQLVEQVRAALKL